MIPKSPIIEYPDTIITEEIVDKVRQLSSQGLPGREISIALRVNIRQVFLILKGEEYFNRFRQEAEENTSIARRENSCRN